VESLTDREIERLVGLACEIRQRITDVFAVAGGGHFGGSMSVVEILTTLYGSILRVDPERPDWPNRDRLILSKGHAAGALCPVLGCFGFFDEGLLDTFNQLGSPFGMHPDMNKIPGCDMSTGSLGHGLATGAGMALAGRADGKDYRVYVILGDGECHEGSVWEAAMVASHYGLENLIAVVDRNRLSLDGQIEEVMSLEPFADRWRSFGWHVVEVDGHDPRSIHEGVQHAHRTEAQPTVLIADTVKGKGVCFMESKTEFHYANLSDEQLVEARSELRRNS